MLIRVYPLDCHAFFKYFRYMEQLRYRFLCLLFLSFMSAHVFSQNLVINEVLAANYSGISDEDEEFSDWIELYNSSSSDLDLSTYKINDRRSAENAWAFPDLMISADGYFILWASGKDRTQTYIHADFKLSQGETVYLFTEDDILVDSLLIQSVCGDVSIGRANNEIRYFDQVTPGGPNNQSAYLGILENSIRFSHDGGIIAPLSLELSTTEDNATIRYTLDASEPTINSEEYIGAISINTNKVVRARLFKNNYLASKSISRTYLLNAQHDLPIIALVTEPDNFFDEDYGMYAFGSTFVNQYPFFGANFWEDWERPLHVSLYEEGELEFETNAGTKIFGGWSRANDLRSLSVFARGQYGSSEIDYKLFPELDQTTFQTFVLRNSGNDFLRSNMRDLTLTSLMKGSGLEFAAHRSVACYLNGTYWGMYNMREKINEHFIASKHDVVPDNIDLLEFNGAPILGDSTEYLNLITYVENNSLETDAKFDVVASQIDVENYIIYNVAQIYFDNSDWPGNNVKFWKTDNTKWRWILYDTDFGFGIWSPFGYFNNTLNFALEANGPVWPNPPWSTLLFRKSVENIGFRNRFINRFADELNSRFLPTRVNQHISNISQHISAEIDKHFVRYGEDPSVWDQELDVLRLFASNRPPVAKNFIISEFDLPDYHSLRLEINKPSQGYVYINKRLKIEQENWSGDYFETVPIELIAVARPGYVFSHWENGVNTDASKISLDLDSDKTLLAVFQEAEPDAASIIINEINYNASADNDSKDWIELHNLSDNYVDLTAWVLKDDDDTHSYVFPNGFLLEGKGYHVISRNIEAFKSIHPDVNNVLSGLGFGFSSGEDQVRLFNNNNALVDSVAYSSSAPWTELANGQGYTLELLLPDLDNLLAENWSHVHVNGSPGISNVDISSVEESEVNLDVQVYPNPISKQFTIEITQEKSNYLSIELLSGDSKLVKTIYQGQISSGTQRFMENISSLPNGSYVLRITNHKDLSILHKLVKI